MKKYSFKNNRERYTEKLIDCIGAAIIAGYHNHADILHGLSCDVMGLTVPKKCAMMLSAGKNPVKIETEGNAMKKYVVIQYRTMNDGSEMETERFEIDETEIDETREKMENLCGMCIDRYEIREK